MVCVGCSVPAHVKGILQEVCPLKAQFISQLSVAMVTSQDMGVSNHEDAGMRPCEVLGTEFSYSGCSADYNPCVISNILWHIYAGAVSL